MFQNIGQDFGLSNVGYAFNQLGFYYMLPITHMQALNIKPNRIFHRLGLEDQTYYIEGEIQAESCWHNWFIKSE